MEGTMKLISKQILADEAYQFFVVENLGNSPRGKKIAESLRKLGPHPDPDTVDLVTGFMSSWTRVPRCGECGGMDPEVVVQVGEQLERDSRTAYLCRGCLVKALTLLGGSSAPDPGRTMERVLTALTAWCVKPDEISRNSRGRATATWHVDDDENRYVEVRDSSKGYGVLVLVRDGCSARSEVLIGDIVISRSIIKSLFEMFRSSSPPNEEGIDLTSTLLSALEAEPDEVLTSQLVAELARENGIFMRGKST